MYVYISNESKNMTTEYQNRGKISFVILILSYNIKYLLLFIITYNFVCGINEKTI